MPQGAWSPKYERMYQHVQATCLDARGRSAKARKTCKRLAAATVNKQRVRAGVTKAGIRCGCPRGYRVLKADKNKCWSPGKTRRGKTCY